MTGFIKKVTGTSNKDIAKQQKAASDAVSSAYKDAKAALDASTPPQAGDPDIAKKVSDITDQALSKANKSGVASTLFSGFAGIPELGEVKKKVAKKVA